MRNVTLVIMRPKNVNECLREILSTSKLSFISLSYIMVLATLLAKNLIVLNIYIYIYIYIYILNIYYICIKYIYIYNITT